MMPDELEELRTRIAAIEANDQAQWRQLKLQRRLQAACLLAVCIGGLLGVVNFKQENRDALERLAIGLVTAGVAGIVGAEALEAVKK